MIEYLHSAEGFKKNNNNNNNFSMGYAKKKGKKKYIYITDWCLMGFRKNSINTEIQLTR